MPDVSQKRLREMLEDCLPCRHECPVNGDHTQMHPPCYPEVQEWYSMAAELLRLRELIGSPDSFQSGSFINGRAVMAFPLEEYTRCRALLEAEHE